MYMENSCLDCLKHGKCASEDYAAINGSIVWGCSGRERVPKPKTRFDEIKSMNVEEFAEYLSDIAGWLPEYEGKAHALLKWLKSEVK